jgi:DNA-binding transcriptional MocR family regulator
VKTKVTRSEALALDKEYNLSDAHTYQLPTDFENETIFYRFSEFYEESVKSRGPDLDRGAFKAFMRASGQPTATKNLWFLPNYAASISTEIVSNALRGNFDEIFLVEPTFDNIADIFKRNGFNVQPIRLSEAKSYFQSITDTIKGNGLTRACIFLVMPNNPTGHGLSEQEFTSLCKLCAERSITVLFDFCFRVFDPSNLYDQYEILLQSGVRFIALEDTDLPPEKSRVLM